MTSPRVTGVSVTRSFSHLPAVDPAPTRPPAGQPRLARELLWNLGLLGAAALSLAVGTALAAEAFPPRVALIGLGALILADLAVVVLFGRYLVGRLVLKPVQGLIVAADRVASGDLSSRAPAAETEEFSRLAERLNEMTESLLDVRSQLVRVEKLAGIGQLAAGIAHEIGNPLAALGTYLEVLKRQGGVDRELVADLGREVDRIDRIVRGLLEYARPEAAAPGPIDPAAAIRAAVALLTRQGRLVQPPALVEIGDGLPPLRGPADALERILVNLVLNALDADPSGRISLRAMRSGYAPRASAARRRGEDAGNEPPRRPVAGRRPSRPDVLSGTEGVLLLVTDHGPGVPEADRERIFDPFFTTKPPGSGIGLGLALVQRAVEDMGGVVWVEDGRTGGAAFKVFLPAHPLPPAERQGGPAA
jgi:signal transduction histidine kinase